MKKLVSVIVAAGFSFAVLAQVDTSNRQSPGMQDENKQDQTGTQTQTDERYCAKLKDGRVVMVSGQREIFNDITLSNGTKIKTEGPVVEKKDGTTKTLKEGECVDAQGNLVKTKSDDKFKKDDDKIRKDDQAPKRY